MADIRRRIVSDLHIAEGASRVRTARAILPLFGDAAHVVLNGDSLETRFLDTIPATARHKEAFDALVAELAARVTVITGNHDPNISRVHHLDLEDGRVLVTHGDTLFPDMAPWGWEAPHFRETQARLLARVPAAARDSWETRLRVCKESVFAIRHLSPRAPVPEDESWKRWLRLLRSVRRFHQIPLTWLRVGERAARLAERYRPKARLVMGGHIHFPGIWRRRGRTFINTGSCTPPLGGYAADFVADRLELRELVFTGGEVRAGAVRKTLDLAQLLAG